MKFNKSAFTIPELLMFLTIVGVVSAAMMSVIRPSERYLPYAYYNAYNALSTAAMNIKGDSINNNLDGHESISEADKSFPGAMSSDDENYAKTSAQELCKKLAIEAKTAEEYGYINTTEYKCASFTPLAANGTFSDSADIKKYAFRATNSMLFYISERGTFDVKDDLLKLDNEVSVTYFIVWVDLNGDRRPNTAVWSDGKPADIVPFIVTTAGQVLPAGGPIADVRYTTARVKYGTDITERYLPRSTTYLEAQIRAYGENQYPSYDQFSINEAIRTKFADTLYAKNKAEIAAIIKKAVENSNGTDKNKGVDEKCDTSIAGDSICTLVVDVNAKL